jgi:hypothetical protein
VLTIQDRYFVHDVFISYRAHEPDRSWVRETLLPRLRAEGFEVCVDYESFRLGAPLVLEMARAVEQSRYVLAVLSPAYLQHNFTELEIVLAEHLGLEEIQRRLLLAVREPSKPPLGMRHRLWVDMTNDEQFDSAIARLVDELHRPAEVAGLGAPDDSPRPGRSLTFEVVEGDIFTFAADLVAFKYAQAFYGADWHAAQALDKIRIDMEALQPKVGDHRLVDPGQVFTARQVLFVGVPPLAQFGYRQIRDFGASVIRILSERVPDCRHLAMTLHGPGVGLDEVEALFSMLTGCMEAVADRPPSSLKQISVVERDAARVGRLRRALQQASHHSGELSVTEAERGWLVQLEGPAGLAGASAQELSQLPGTASDRKPHIFVAMPFAEAFSDLFEYGIQRPVRDLGFLCERVDQDVFTGDILERIKTQIETSTAIIAVLTGANPNVYLEVGYAWGKGRPTILVTEDDPRFDLQGQRYLKYRRIKDVDEMLTRELRALKEQGHI